MKKITDKDLIVYLVGKGFKIKKTLKDRNRSIIYFQQSKQLNDAILDYVNKADSKYNSFQEAERRVKTLMCLNKDNK